MVQGLGNPRRRPWSRGSQSYLRALGTLLLLILLGFPAQRTQANPPHLLRIGTGGHTGVYYPVGKLLAQGLTGSQTIQDGDKSGEHGIPGYVCVAQNSAGSVDNVRGVTANEIEIGLVQADVAAWASQSTHVFAKESKVGSIRAIASLYPEKFQVVVRRDAGIRTFADLRQKRISIDEMGSGTLVVMRIVLDAHGMTESDLNPVYLKPVFTHDKIISGELQGFVMMGGAPMAAVSKLAGVGITLVPIPPKMAAKIEAQYPYLTPSAIPAGAYPGLPAITTIQVHALLVVDAGMEDGLAYQITAALWSRRTQALLTEGHPQGRAITPQTALAGISIPLHPGAQAFYLENPEIFNEP